MKRWISGLLAAAMTVGFAVVLCACGKTQTVDITGVWQRDTVFLPYFNCEADLTLEIKEDGTYIKKTVEHDADRLLDMETGSWTFEQGVLSCEKGENLFIRYQYNAKDDSLENAGNIYRRSV